MSKNHCTPICIFISGPQRDSIREPAYNAVSLDYDRERIHQAKYPQVEGEPDWLSIDAMVNQLYQRYPGIEIVCLPCPNRYDWPCTAKEWP